MTEKGFTQIKQINATWCISWWRWYLTGGWMVAKPSDTMFWQQKPNAHTKKSYYYFRNNLVLSFTQYAWRFQTCLIINPTKIMNNRWTFYSKKGTLKCIKCIHFSAKPITQLMGNLPIARITPCRAFDKVRINFAGPVIIKCHHKRKY